MKLSASLLTLALLAGCAATAHTSPKTPWRIDVVTSGGIAGRGTGTFAITSDGKVAYTSPMHTSCTFTLSADELQRFTTILGDADAAHWKESYIPKNPCCDRFEYDLTYDEAGTVTKTKWIDDPEPMPKGLADLAAAIIGGPGSIRAQAVERCQ